jgi:Type IV secretion system pilin
MNPTIKKIAGWMIPLACVSVAIFSETRIANAQSALGPGWDQFLKTVPGLNTFAGTGTSGGEDVAMATIRQAIGVVKYGVGGVALIFGILYATNLIFARGSEDTITKQKKNFLWAFIGFVILMAADSVSSIFNPIKATSQNLIDFKAARDQLRDIAQYVEWVLGSIIVLLMTISGIRMIMASGKEEEIATQKRNLVWSAIGMMVILLASNIVNAFYVINTGEVASPQNASQTMGNVIRLILVFMGPVAILFTIYAGFLYLFYFDKEERLKQARTMMIGGVTGIVIIYSAYALVNTFFATSPLTQ